MIMIMTEEIKNAIVKEINSKLNENGVTADSNANSLFHFAKADKNGYETAFTFSDIITIFNIVRKHMSDLDEKEIRINFGDEGGSYGGDASLTSIADNGKSITLDGDSDSTEDALTAKDIIEHNASNTNMEVYLANMDEGGDYGTYRMMTLIYFDKNGKIYFD